MLNPRVQLYPWRIVLSIMSKTSTNKIDNKKANLTLQDLDSYRKNNIGQSLLEVARDFQKNALTEYTKAGHSHLQISHQAILTHLSLSGSRLTELAQRASMTKQAMGQLIDEVERLGYVKRMPDPTDGRAKIVCFTDQGRTLIKSGTEIGDTIQEKYSALIGEKKMHRLRDLLEELHEQIRKQ